MRKMAYFNHKFTAYSIMMLFIKNMTLLKSPTSFYSACSKEKIQYLFNTRSATNPLRHESGPSGPRRRRRRVLGFGERERQPTGVQTK